MFRRVLIGQAIALALVACAKKPEKKPPQIPEVGYVVLTTQAAPLEIELAGRTAAFETADVRPQVSGLIKARHFVEGSLVRQGQTLYEIDPRPYQAVVNQAQANLASAQASRTAADTKAARYKPLAQIQAVSQQDYTDAVAAAQQAAASVQQSAAALETARINLQFTRVPAPIGGRIGRSFATTGALVTNAQTSPLATIERLDPIFVDIQQSSTDLTHLRQELATGGVTPSTEAVQLKLEDGASYPSPGRLEFSEVIVDQNTGAVTLRARFPNPNGLLLPGMFVRAQLTQVIVQNAIMVPQQAVSRDPKGEATVFVVAAGNKAVLRTVTAAHTLGADWVVTGGLVPGEKVITEGLDNVHSGDTVRPVPAGSPPQQQPSPKAADKASDGA